MPETQLFKTEAPTSRAEIAETLRRAADQIESGTVDLEGAEQSQQVDIPPEPTFEVELERMTDSETGAVTHELEWEILWTDSA
jgi:amphi-Trp domain-containing protein